MKCSSRSAPRLLWLLLAAASSSFCLSAPLQAHADGAAGQAHFEAGVRAYDQQRFADAAHEFEAAYAAAPAWQVLYNLGTVYSALGEPVAAIDAFEGYLQQADASLGAERRAQVQRELELQRHKVGQLRVEVSCEATPCQSEVRIDAKLVGYTPLLQPLALRVGKHMLELTREGYRPERSEIEVVALQHSVVRYTLRKLVAVSTQPQPPGATVEQRQPGTVQRALGWSLGGVGIGGLIASGVVLAKGQLKHQRAVELANADRRSEAEVLESQADRQRTIGFAVLGVGAAVLLGGVITLWAAPRASSSHVTLGLAPSLAARTQGVRLLAQW